MTAGQGQIQSSKRLLLISLLVVFLASFLASIVQNSGGRVHVQDIKIPTQSGVVPMMFVLPYLNRYFFNMTGRIYLGPMTTGLIFIMILISNTVIYLPL
jgi:hypothetical protein